MFYKCILGSVPCEISIALYDWTPISVPEALSLQHSWLIQGPLTAPVQTKQRTAPIQSKNSRSQWRWRIMDLTSDVMTAVTVMTPKVLMESSTHIYQVSQSRK